MLTTWCPRGVTAAIEAGRDPDAREYMARVGLDPQAVWDAHSNAAQKPNPEHWETEAGEDIERSFAGTSAGFTLTSKVKYDATHATAMTLDHMGRLHATEVTYRTVNDFTMVAVPALGGITQVFVAARDGKHQPAAAVAAALMDDTKCWEACTATLCRPGDDEIKVDLLNKVVGVYSDDNFVTDQATQTVQINLTREGSSAAVKTEIKVVFRSMSAPAPLPHIELDGCLSFAYIIGGKVHMVAALDPAKFGAFGLEPMEDAKPMTMAADPQFHSLASPEDTAPAFRSLCHHY